MIATRPDMKGQEGEMDDDELAARLRAADPAATLSPLDPERRTRLLEDTMSTQTPTEHTSGVGRWLPLAAAAVLLIAGLGLWFGTRGDDGDRPSADPSTSQSPSGSEAATVTELGAPAAPDGRCMTPNAEVLGKAQIALDATVESITPDEVVLTPTHWYAGDETDRVVVKAPAVDLDRLVQSVDFQKGSRFLVAANDDTVMICGFSGPYEPGREKLYRTAFAK